MTESMGKQSRAILRIAPLLALLLFASVAVRAHDSAPKQADKSSPGKGTNVPPTNAQTSEPRVRIEPKAEAPDKPTGAKEETQCAGAKPSGAVRLRMLLRADRTVSDITVLKSPDGGLTEKAVEAAKQIKFTPSQKDGRNVHQWVTIEYNFEPYYDETEVTTRAVILSKPQPEYTKEALEQRVIGTVRLEVDLSASGEAHYIKTIQELPYGLTQKAIEAVRQIKFRPATKDTCAVTQRTIIEYQFTPDLKKPDR